MTAPWTALAHMLAHPFMAHAYLAGSAVAAAAGLVGYFLVLRSQVFTADALSHASFTGALAALALGVDARLGLFAVTAAVALGMGALGRRGRPGDVVIGGLFAWVLGLGVFFLSLYTTTRSAGNGTASVSVLFGSVLGLTAGQAWVAAGVAGVICLLVVGMARPLLFASLDEAVAASRRVPVRALGVVFLLAVAAMAAEATQVVGALLILGLLAAPAGAAHRLTDRPLRGLCLAALVAVASVWVGLAASYAIPRVPPSFAIMMTAAGAFAGAAAWRARYRRTSRTPVTSTAPATAYDV